MTSAVKTSAEFISRLLNDVNVTDIPANFFRTHSGSCYDSLADDRLSGLTATNVGSLLNIKSGFHLYKEASISVICFRLEIVACFVNTFLPATERFRPFGQVKLFHV